MSSQSTAASTTTNSTSLFASLLPVYNELDGILLQSALIADTLLIESTADFERLHTFNIDVIESPATNSIFLLPLRLPTIGEALDFDYIGTANHAFFTLRGAPGRYHTYAAFIGYSGGPPDVPLVQGALVRLPTPRKFLVAKGDWLITASAMVAPAAGAGKRPREVLQDEEGVQQTTAGEGSSKTFLEDLDGGKRMCRDMTKAAKREAELGPVWRLTLGRERDVVGRGQILQTSEYLKAIWAAAMDPSLDGTGLYQDAPLILHIAELPIAKDPSLVSSLIQARFGPSEQHSLQAFSRGGSRPADKPTLKGRRQIADSLNVLSMAMRIFYSPDFSGCMAPLIEVLTGAADPLKLVPDDLLQHSLDVCLSRWGMTVRSEKQSASFPNVALSTPAGCAALLTLMLEATVASLAAERVVLQDLHFRTYIQPTLKLVPVVRAEKGGAAKAAPSTICSYNLLKQLKVATSKGSLITCSRGKDCTKRHLVLSKLSDTTIRAVIAGLPEALRTIALSHLEESQK